MGYRSDIRIRTTKEGFEIIKAEIEKTIKENNLNEDYNLLKINGVEITETKDAVTIDWHYLKWYEEYKDVSAVMRSLDILAEKNIDYQYARIGEDIEDNEEIWRVENGSFDSFYIARYFEG